LRDKTGTEDVSVKGVQQLAHLFAKEPAKKRVNKKLVLSVHVEKCAEAGYKGVKDKLEGVGKDYLAASYGLPWTLSLYENGVSKVIAEGTGKEEHA
jgi:hypothetical protein